MINTVISLSVFLFFSVLAHRSALTDISIYLLIAARAVKGNGKGQTLSLNRDTPTLFMAALYLSIE